MTKNEYIQLRATLNFRPEYGWLASHMVGDFFLAGWPAVWLVARGGVLQWQAVDVILCALAWMTLSVFYFRSFSMMHECVHGTLGTSRRFNNAAGLLYGVFCFLPFAQWRDVHLVHHHWAGNVEKDPVMKLVLEFREPPTRWRAFLSFLWRSWFPILAILQYQVFWFVCAARFKEDRRVMTSMSMVVPILFWSGVVWLAGAKITAFVILPSVLLYLAIVEVINFPHHMSLPQYEGETKLSLWNQYQISRSCIYPRWMSRFVLLNFNYHTEHHLFPALPWYRLDALSETLRRELPGYNFSIGNEWILKNRKKPLEDVSKAPVDSTVVSTRQAA